MTQQLITAAKDLLALHARDAVFYEIEETTCNALRAAIEAAEKQEPVPQAAPVAQHPDDIAIDRFAAAMKVKMAKQRDKGYYGWDDALACSASNLQRMLSDHIAKGDPVDVGNFSMMLFNRGEATSAPVAQQEAKPLSEAEVSDLRSRYGWAKETIRAIEAALDIGVKP